jgi:MFS family permease
VNCQACGKAEARRTTKRCAECGWKFDGPLANILSEIQKFEPGGDTELCKNAITPLLRRAGLSADFGRMIDKLIVAGNPDRAARLITEQGQRQKRDWRGAARVVLAGLGTLGVFSALYMFVGVPSENGPPFDFLFILLGALFCGLSASGFANPQGITVGAMSGSQLSPQQFTSSGSATKAQGMTWAVLMLAGGLGMAAFGVFGGAIL